MRFHVCALPHTNTTKEFISCAYTAKVINFCRMMVDRGHEVYLYGGVENEAPCEEHVVCVSEEERSAHVGAAHFTSASFDGHLPFWRKANAQMAEAIRERAHTQDFVCVIGGVAQKQIADLLPTLITVEFGVGYGGTFSKYRVFESYAWMHTVYGAETRGNPHAADGNWWDTVIPGYLDPDQFPFSAEKDDYYLFIGRLIERKGAHIASEVCRHLNKRLVVAGQGTPPLGSDYVGVVGPEERGILMSRAKAVFVPTIYVEPFANVHVEAQACGTPVITTDWGVFTETVENGVNGFRCRTFKEFVSAAQAVSGLDALTIRDRAIARYSLNAVGAMYENYFNRLGTLWGDGWYA
jgi:glycosyltransferase involved in cell wall biosynthesis